MLDTNVVVSAHLSSRGLERFVLDLALARKLRMYVSREILTEYREVLARPRFGIRAERLAESLRLIKSAAKTVKPREKLRLSPDEDDNKFLECAAEAQAHYLVTGNKRHFPQSVGETLVVNARELIEIIATDLQR